MSGWFWNILWGVISAVIAGAISLSIRWLYNKFGKREIRGKFFWPLLGVAFVFGLLVALAVGRIGHGHGRISVVKPEQPNIEYASEKGYLVRGQFKGGQGSNIYIVSRRLGTEVWTVLGRGEPKEPRGSWSGRIFFEKMGQTANVEGKYEIRAILTKKKFNIADRRSLPKLNDMELSKYRVRSDFFSVTVISANARREVTK